MKHYVVHVQLSPQEVSILEAVKKLEGKQSDEAVLKALIYTGLWQKWKERVKT